jgi:hypothetical protein
MKVKVRKLKNRSRKAPCDVCGTISILQNHHIRGRKIVNANYEFNLTSLCGRCHNEVHFGEIIIEDWIMTSNGKELMWHYKGKTSFTERDAKPHLFSE